MSNEFCRIDSRHVVDNCDWQTMSHTRKFFNRLVEGLFDGRRMLAELLTGSVARMAFFDVPVKRPRVKGKRRLGKLLAFLSASLKTSRESQRRLERRNAFRVSLGSNVEQLEGRALMAVDSITTLGVPVTENFDGMAATTALPSAWRMHASTASPVYTSASTSVTQQASSGSPTAGGTYNWGSTTSERAVGAMTSGGFASPNNLLAKINNDSGSVITSLSVSYSAERYRVNSAAASVSFFYSLDGTNWTAMASGDIAASSFPTGSSTYTFASPLVVNRTGISITGLSIANTSSVYLRWNINTTGSNSQGIGIDNISVTGTGVASTSTTTALSTISPLTVNEGASITFTGTVVAGTGTTTPTGTIEIRNGGAAGTLLASTTTIGGSGANGTFSFNSTSVPAGTYSNLQAFYVAGSGFSNSNSAVFGSTLTVNSLSTTTTTALNSISPLAATSGDAVVFAGTITAGSGSTLPAGTVEIRNGGAGGTLLASTSTITGSGVNGAYSISSTTVPVGTYNNVQAFFIPGSGFAASSSAVFGSALTISAVSLTTLTAGDIAFTGIRSDAPDTFTFVLLKNVVSGTTLSFTDNGWATNQAGFANTSENTATVTFGSAYAAGTHFRVSDNSGTPTFFLVGTTTAAGTISGNLSGISAGGDAVLAYQGTAPTSGSATNWVAGISTNAWGTSSSTNFSALPTALASYSIALSTTASDIDNGSFNLASLTGTTAQIRTAVNNLSNWTLNNDDTLVPEPTTTFTIASNSPPTDLNLSATSLAENGPANATVGTLSTVDPDTSDTFVYALIGGTGSDDNSSFNILGSALRANAGFDFESKPNYSVRLQTTDPAGQTFEKTFTISVTNVNEAPTDIALSSATIAENAGANATVGTLSTVDPDAGNTFAYALVSGIGADDNEAFSISGATLAANAGFDFETKSSYTIRVRSTDQGGLSTEKSFTIGVTNVNEAPTVVAQTFTVAENSANGTVVGTVAASDVDAGTTLSYTLSGTGAAAFAIDANGQITVANSSLLNFETTPVFNLSVAVSDGTLSTSAAVTINLTNVNEAPTVAAQTFNVAENSANGTVVGTVVASDVDAGTTLSYTLSGTGAAAFAIDANGQITVANSGLIDFETTPIFNLSVAVSDGTLSTSAAVTINLTNVNEAPAVAAQTFSVAENAVNSTAVGTVAASDVDAGTTLSYMLSGTGAAAFAIDANGQITVANSSLLDFETTPVFNLSVAVSDGTLSTSAAVTINLTNVNEAPTVAAQSFSLAENSANGTVVGTIAASDVDAGTTLSYTLSGTGAAAFAIDANGQITVANSSLLDFETTPVFNLSVAVSDGTLSTSAAVTINLTNVNDAPVFAQGSYSFSVPENSASTTVVGSVSASDVDAGSSLTYSLSGSGSGNFAINPATGAITVAAGATLNFETTPSYSLTASVSDGSLSTTVPVTITLTNVNEAPTDVALSNSSVAENAGTNAVVGILSTSDPDAASAFTYTLVSGTGSTDNAAFNISGATLRASASFDFETKSSYTVRVRSTDQGGFFIEKAFVITVTGVNEAPTDIDLSNSSIEENAGSNALVGTLSTSDPDSANTFTYTLVSGTGSADNAAFTISGANLTANSSFDLEAKSNYSIRVRSADQGGLFTEKSFTISVVNANDAPVFSLASYSFTLAENSAATTAVGTVNASDPDVGAVLTYSLSGTGSNNFVIHPSTGAITVAAGANLDFETTPNFNLTASVSDGGLSATVPVEITLTNVAEAPIFSAASYSFSIAENAAAETAVGSVNATDQDAASTLVYSLSGTGSSNFAINPVTGAITVSAGATLDFETTPSFNLTVSASDGNLSSSAPVGITLTNVNEVPTDLALSNTAIAENAGNNALVGTLSTSDPDAANTFIYTLVSGVGSDDNAAFNINGNSLRANSGFDFEGKNSYTLRVRSTDQGGLFTEKSFTISVTNVNEAPQFGSPTYAYTIVENAVEGTAVGSTSASDVDAGAVVTYSLSGTGASNFTISPTTGAIAVAAGASLDFETTSSYVLTVLASDGSLASTASVSIDLTDVNEAPEFGAPSYSFSVPENSVAGTSIGSVSATDEDAGSTLTYSLSGTGSTQFAIDAVTGAITVAAGANLDFETTPSYSLTATVTDGTLTTTVPVTIALTDLNDQPSIAPQSFTLAENSVNGTTVGTVVANAANSFAITAGNVSSAFAIDANSGVLSVANVSALDFEVTPTFSLTVMITAIGGVTASNTVTVNLTNVNESPTLLEQSLVVNENAVNGAVVGTVTATDPDVGDVLTFSITGGNSLGALAISPSGQVSVADGTKLNFEATPVIALTVLVTDAAGLTSLNTVSVLLNDLNESPVVVASLSTLPENSATGTIVGSASATDPDQGQTLSYRFSNGLQTSGPLLINATTGEISVSSSGAFNFEIYNNSVHTIQAVDNGSPTRTGSTQVTLTLLDVNEAPVFTAGSYTFEFLENEPAGTAVGTTRAFDPDAGSSVTHTLSGTGSSNFSIDATTGAITVAAGAEFDAFATPQYSLTAQATDGTFTVSAPVTINVRNFNYFPVINSQSFSIPENSAVGTNVGTVVATDRDSEQTLTYAITGGNSSGAFAINNATGQITVANSTPLNRETQPTFALTVTVSDSGDPSLSASNTVFVTLSNVNEAPTISAQTFTVEEGAPNGATVGFVAAFDVDAGDTKTFAIISGNGLGAFALNASTGRLTVADTTKLEFDVNPTFALEVSVTDAGGLSASATMTINLTDVEYAPVINPQSFTIPENLVNGSSVGVVVASDRDQFDTKTFSLTSDPTSAFTINPSTGQISVADFTKLNYESLSVMLITVRVTDSTNLSASATITINLTDVNEVPVSDLPGFAFDVSENSPAGTTVGPVTATDPDTGAVLNFALSGTGSSDFAIDTATGVIAVAATAMLDFETIPTYELTVQISDGELSVTVPLTITLTNVNDAPTDIVLSNSTVAENAGVETSVGTLSTSDQDAGNSFTYTFVSGTGGDDNAAFTLTGATLTANASFDFETKSSYTVRVRSTDQGGLFTEKVFVIAVTNVNEAPTDIALSNATIAENAGANAPVGIFSTVDPDAGETFAYALVSGTGSEDNASFAISGSTLTANASFDFETKSSYSIRVRSTDAGGLFTEETFTISVTNIHENSAPIDIVLSSVTIAENAGSNATVGALSTTDADAGDTHTYTLVGGTGSADNAAFAIAGNTLTANSSFDFETKSNYTVRVRSTDQGGLFTEKEFTINVTNVNEAPTMDAQTLSLHENSANGAVVGAVVANDVDAGDTLAFAITAGNSSGAFAIDANTGVISVANGSALDFETTPNFALTVSVTDAGNLSASNTVSINLTNVNEAPTIAAQTFSVAENSANGTALGTVVASDVDAGDTLAFAITGGNSLGAFAIDMSTGAISVANSAALDFETTPAFALNVSVTDAGSLSASHAVTVNLANVNEAPTNLDLSNSVVAENAGANATVGTLSTIDPDADNTFTYALVSGVGSDDNSAFTLSGATLTANSSLDFEAKSAYSILVRSTDQGGLTFDRALTISVTNVNEAPAGSNRTITLEENGEYTFSVANFGFRDSLDVPANNLQAVRITTLPGNGTLTLSGVAVTAGQFITAESLLAGNLKFTPVANAHGIPYANLTFQVQDDGGTSGGGGDLDETPNTITINVNQPLTVQSVTPNATGFEVVFNRPMSAAQVNLYDQGGALGEADVALVGATSGPIRGSLVLNSTNTGFTFIKTGMLNVSGGSAVAGTLAPDTYTLTLRSDDTDGFVDLAGNALRDVNNVAADFVQSFVVGTPAANTLTLSIPDFARGFSQAVNVPNTSTGLPVMISNANNVGSVDLTIHYDPALLTITGVSTPIAGASATINTSTPGIAVIQLSSASALASVDGPATILNLIATVPESAPYASKGVISFSSILVQDTSLSVVPTLADNAVHVAAFFGDLNGDQGYDSADTVLVQRLGLGLISGVTAYQTLDPFVIADSLNDYVFDSADTITIQRLGVGIAVPSVPALPSGVGSSHSGNGVGPALSIGEVTASSAAAGTHVFVPINLLVTEASGNSLASMDFAISFDPSRFQVTAGGVTIASSTQNGLIWETDAAGNSNPNLAGVGFSLANPNIDNVAGTIRIQAFSPDGTRTLPVGTAGTLLRVRFTVKAGAAAGSSSINLLANAGETVTRLRDNSFTTLSLVPAPTNASTDTIDGSITILGAGNAAPTSLSLSNASLAENNAVGATIGTFITTDPNGGDTHTYSLVSGAGDTDNAAFTISGSMLFANATFDFETKNSYSIRVRTTDGGGLFFENFFTVNILNVNESPTHITLSSTTVQQNSVAGTVVGTLAATDPDYSNDFTYSLVPGTGSTDNTTFQIVNGQLWLATSIPSRATRSSYSVRLRVTDAGGLSFEESFEIDVIL